MGVDIIHYTLFSSLKNICNKKDFHVALQTCWWKRPFHVGCQDKSGPGKIHEVILVNNGGIWKGTIQRRLKNGTHFSGYEGLPKEYNVQIIFGISG